jgi:hypothetical protein
MSGSRKQARHAASLRNQRRRAAIERRRQNARGLGIEASAASYRRRQRRLRILAGAGGAAVVLVAVVVFVRSRPEPGVRRSMIAALVEGADGALAITDEPGAYTVTYRVEAYSDDGTDTVTTQDFAIRRPFDSRIISKADAPPGGDEQWSVTSSIGRYQQSAQAEAATAEVSAPMSALGDYRLDASLSDLVADGTFVLGDRRTLLGRECQVYRTGSTLESYTVAAPTETDYSDVCIDAAGLMLEELSVATGQVTQHQIATAIDLAADVADDDFTISATPTDLAGGGRELEDIDMTTTPVAGFWSFAEAPAGYGLQHRYVLRQTVTDPSSDPSDASDTTGGATTTTTAPASTVAESYIDVYVDGTNVVTVRQGPSSVDPGFDSSVAKDAATSNLGAVQTTSGVTGSVVSATPTSPADWFIQVTGTIPRADLLAVVEQLSTA